MGRMSDVVQRKFVLCARQHAQAAKRKEGEKGRDSGWSLTYEVWSPLKPRGIEGRGTESVKPGHSIYRRVEIGQRMCSDEVWTRMDLLTLPFRKL